MTPREAEALSALNELSRVETNQRQGTAPMSIGGKDGSHHSKTLTRMVAKGWVERTFGGGWGEPHTGLGRGSARYRISPLGCRALANHNALANTVGDIVSRSSIVAKIRGKA